MVAAVGERKDQGREWLPVGYDPARLDLDKINKALTQLGTGALQR